MVLTSGFSSYNSNSRSSSYLPETEVPSPPHDTVSELQFATINQQGTFLLSTSWDGKVSIWQVQSQGNLSATLKIQKSPEEQNPMPLLGGCWYSEDNSKVFLASADNKIKAIDLATQQCVVVGSHDKAVQKCHFFKSSSFVGLISTSLDKSVKFWDLRQQNPVNVLNLPERIYCSDVSDTMAVFGTSGSSVHFYSFGSQMKEEGVENLRTVGFDHLSGIKIIKNSSNTCHGYIACCNEGKVRARGTNPDFKYNYSAHREQHPPANIDDVYSINCLAIHPIHRTLLTGSSDGTFKVIDYEKKQLIMTSPKPREYYPITSSDISQQGDVLAIAKGYDWSKGYENYLDSCKPKIVLISCYNAMQRKS
ncbi:MAG: Poly(A)+ RNA export protein rae1 [Paramarteilia canceri]